MMKTTPIKNIWVLAQYTLRESLKNRILWIAAVFAVLGIGGASFVGDFAVVEYKKTEAGVLAAFYRFCGVFAIIVLVVSTMVREFNDKCLELYLSLPMSRIVYFAGKLSGFFVTGLAVAAVYAAVMFLYAEPAVVLFWFFSFVCEIFIIAAVSFFCVMTFNQQVPASVMTAFFFYLLCRIGDDLILISQSELILHTFGAEYLGMSMRALVVILPSLGRFTQSDWLMYGDPAVTELLPIIIGETVIYTVLLGGAALFDFLRKNL